MEDFRNSEMFIKEAENVIKKYNESVENERIAIMTEYAKEKSWYDEETESIKLNHYLSIYDYYIKNRKYTVTYSLYVMNNIKEFANVDIKIDAQSARIVYYRDGIRIEL